MGELKCPVCMRYMTPPIPMCQNGHNVCSTCRQEMNQCPTCRQGFLESRCWILENIIQKIQYRCQYYVKGCEFVSTAGIDIASHEAHCPLRPFRCPFADDTTVCCWRGEMSAMWNHIQRQHGSQCVTAARGKCTFTLNCSGPHLSRMALSAWGETFFVVSRVINFDLYCCVLYVGPEEKASEYKYRIILTRPSCSHMTLYLPTQPYFVDTEALFRNMDCAIFLHGVRSGHGYGFTGLGSCEVQIGYR